MPVTSTLDPAESAGRLNGGGIEVLRDCAIPLPDGSGVLAADVYLPAGGRPCPALVTLLPYHKDGLAGIDGWRANQFLAGRGYACVLVDFRGTGASGGAPRPPFDDGECDDGVAAVAWAAEQPWCDGNVGMWGASYGAMTALRTATRRPPQLKAVIAVIGHADHGHEFVHPGGARALLSPLASWGLTTLALQLLPPLRQDADGRWLRRWRERLEAMTPYAIDLAGRDPADTWTIDVGAIDVPVFCVGGWNDLNRQGTLDTYGRLRSPKKLLMGPWMHTLPEESPFAPADFLSVADRWWARWLRGDENGIDAEPSATVFLQGAERWQHFDRWPPRAGGAVEWRADGDGVLGTCAPAVRRDRRLEVDPTVGTGGGLWSLPTRGFGLPHDQHDDDARSLSFTSAPLEAPLQITGRPRVRLRLVSESVRTVVVKLARVGRDGRSTLVTTGTAVLPADGPAAIEIPVHDTSVELAEGERLRLVLAGGDFPRLWPGERGGRLTLVDGDAVLVLPGEPAGQPGAAPARAQPAPPHPLLLRAEPSYSVARDYVHDGVELRLGEQLLARTPDGSGVLGLEQAITASVSRREPGAAAATGRATATLTSRQGTFVVRGELLLRRHLTVANGSVAWDGAPVFERRWTA